MYVEQTTKLFQAFRQLIQLFTNLIIVFKLKKVDVAKHTS